MTGSEVWEKCALFDGFDRSQLQLLDTFCRRLAFEEDTVIFKEGELARQLYVVTEGKVALEMAIPRLGGGVTRPAMVATVNPLEAFGWSAIVEPHVFTLAARTLERTTLRALDADTLREMLAKYRDAGYLAMRNMSRLLALRLAQTRESLLYERGWALMA